MGAYESWEFWGRKAEHSYNDPWRFRKYRHKSKRKLFLTDMSWLKIRRYELAPRPKRKAKCYESSTVLPDVREYKLIAAALLHGLQGAITRVPTKYYTKTEISRDRNWVGSGSMEPFSFLWCCQMLELEPEYLRRWVGV